MLGTAAAPAAYHLSSAVQSQRSPPCPHTSRALPVSRTLSPKILARAIGVSESSLKRWSDDGLLRADRTAGGHRRITLQEAVRFIRSVGATVVRADLLGLAELAALGGEWASTADVPRAFHTALEGGHAAQVRAMTQALYLSGWPPAAIFDGPMRSSLAEIGELWLHAEWGIVVEHRATDVCIQAINQLRFLSPVRTGLAPVAVGSAAESDPYMLPSLMAAAVVGDCGFLDVNLGTITPPLVLANAAAHYKAKLAWVSISAAPDMKKLATDISKLSVTLRATGCALVIGGRMAGSLSAAEIPGVMVANSMAELGAFARGVIAQHETDIGVQGRAAAAAALEEASGRTTNLTDDDLSGSADGDDSK